MLDRIVMTMIESRESPATKRQRIIFVNQAIISALIEEIKAKEKVEPATILNVLGANVILVNQIWLARETAKHMIDLGFEVFIFWE